MIAKLNLLMEKQEASVSGTLGPHRSRKWEPPRCTVVLLFVVVWRWASILVDKDVCVDVDMGLSILNREVLSPRHRGWIRISQ